MALQLLTVGADPELFLTDGKNLIPSIGLLGGTKEEPNPVEKGAIQEDNVLAEFNIDPVTNEDMFVDHLETVMGELGKVVAPLKLKVLSSAHFSLPELVRFGPQALQFGCDPDVNAWTGEFNQAPDPTSTMRTAGGHIHVGIDAPEDDFRSRANVVKLMDIYLGVPSVLLDADNERRKMYGKAGACRFKPYGVEYRTLSNFWLQSEASIRWAYRQTQQAVDSFDNLDELLVRFPPELIQNTINNSDVDAAQRICKELQI